MGLDFYVHTHDGISYVELKKITTFFKALIKTKNLEKVRSQSRIILYYTISCKIKQTYLQMVFYVYLVSGKCLLSYEFPNSPNFVGKLT